MKLHLMNEQSTGIIKRIELFLIVLIAFFTCGKIFAQSAKTPIQIDNKYLLVSVDAANCRWSLRVKGTEMQLNDVYFLPGDDPSGWKVVSSIKKDDSNDLGSFVTVTLKGKKPGQPDFEYEISVSKTGNDVIVSLGRTNNTSKPVDIGDMDYFVSADARLGGTADNWVTLGTQSRNRDLYELLAVINLITPKTYAVNSVIKDPETGNSLLMGHVTAFKGASRFDVRSSWKGRVPDRMQVRGYCSYKITIPPGKSFTGEKLLIDFNRDALRAMEHQGDLIAIAHDVRLKQGQLKLMTVIGYLMITAASTDICPAVLTPMQLNFLKIMGLRIFTGGLEGPEDKEALEYMEWVEAQMGGRPALYFRLNVCFPYIR